MLLQYCVNEEKLELILKFIVISSMILAITVLFNDFDSIINGERLGMGLEEFNSNDIGLKLSLSSIIVLYLLLKFKNKIYLFPYVLLLSVTLLTGSKKSLLVLILGNLIFFLLGSGKYKIRNLILLFIMLSSIFYLIFNNETLYDILGSRLEDMLSAFSGGKIESTHTDMVRINMTETGFQFFSEKPVFGYGLDSFKILYGNATGMFTYSHNNYIELAVNLGLVGFILYYCMYFFILIKGFKLYKNNPKDKLILLSLVIVSILMVIEVGLVSYIDKFYLILILLSYFSITFKKNNEESNHV
ncbi:O-antigen ligase family protein [Peribacillus simplex]|uniref:O-antigen ligase family protein n=1 Tax=Peribacillus simplex TaxID=1478 RepID=UPI003D28CF23